MKAMEPCLIWWGFERILGRVLRCGFDTVVSSLIWFLDYSFNVLALETPGSKAVLLFKVDLCYS
jgi:hypothetical protein